MSSILTRLQQKLNERSQNGNLRTLQVAESGIDFCSNDYLGLSLIELSSKETPRPNGGSSRLISGTKQLHLDVEKKLAEKFNHESALLFNNGYSANCGLFSAIGLKDTIFIYDERAHASIKDGIRLSFAKSYSFEHNNLSDLKRLLAKFQKQTVFVVVESLYSMDGDFALLKEIADLTEEFGAELIVDEAHTGGLFADKGYCEAISLPKVPFARIFTFGKAYGSHGACVVSSITVIDYLINYSRPFIYTTALSARQVVDIEKKVLHLSLEDKQLKLQENISYFRKAAAHVRLRSEIKSPIQSILIPTNKAARAMENKLERAGLAVKAILSPTVKEGHECIRISLHSFNTKEEIDLLIKHL